MEEAMTDRSAAFQNAVRAAALDGPTAEPLQLIAVLSTVEQAIAALSDNDRARSFFAALFDEFDFLQGAMQSPAPFQPLQQDRWAKLLRWIFREIRDWAKERDPADRTVAAIFVIAQASHNEFWSWVPVEILNNNEWIERLKSMVRSFAFNLGGREGRAAPIWEREAVEKFEAADRAGDWATIGGSLHLFERQLFWSTPLTQSVRSLYACGMHHLRDALSAIAQSLLAIEVSKALSAGQSLHLAANSDNPHLQLACVYQVFTANGRGDAVPTDAFASATALLRKVADDSPRWVQWMKVFNAFPVRFQALQVPLGHALAEVSDFAVQAYINSIILTAVPAGQRSSRALVTQCLRVFRESASPERRSWLWTCAHDRWAEWNFGAKNSGAHLLTLNWSELDFPSMMFALECLDDAGRERALLQIINQLRTIELQWFESSTDAVTEWNRLLSRYQAYSSAIQTLSTGEDWPSETKACLPFDLKSNDYSVMKYRMTLR
jgi:hypothetical protein